MKKFLLVSATAMVALLATARPLAAQSNRFLAGVPTDTPYVFATLAPMPEGLLSMMFESLDGIDKMVQKAAKEVKGKTPEDKLARALLSEFKGKFNRKGFESFGFTMSPHFVLYGLGPLPVGRLELRDGKKLKAAFNRVIKKAGLKVKPQKSNNKEYWIFGDDPDVKIAIAIQDKEVDFAVVQVKHLDATLPHLFGTATVPNPMTDPKVLTEVMNKHKFTPYGVGYGDFDLAFRGLQGMLTGVTGTFWSQLTGGVGAMLPAACKKEVNDDIKRFPRVVAGYDQFDRTALGMSLVLEGDPSMVSAIKGIAAEVPGFHADYLRDSRMAIGAAMKIPEAKKLGLRLAGALDALGKACQATDLSDGARDLREKLGEQLPPQLENSRGAYLVGLDFDLPEGGMVENIHGYATMQTKEPAAILAELEMMAQGQVKLKVPADGKFHALSVAMLEPFTDGVYLATDKQHIVLAAGSRGKAAAEKAKASQLRTSPFLFFGYDMAYILKKVGPALKGKEEAEMLKSMASLYKGPGAMWIAPSPHGLAVSTRLSLVSTN